MRRSGTRTQPVPLPRDLQRMETRPLCVTAIGGQK